MHCSYRFFNEQNYILFKISALGLFLHFRKFRKLILGKSNLRSGSIFVSLLKLHSGGQGETKHDRDNLIYLVGQHADRQQSKFVWALDFLRAH